MGLTIVLEIVERYRGKLEVCPPGEDTAIRVAIPQKK